MLGAVGVLDIFHASAHLHAAAVARDEGATAWYERARRRLLELGAAGVIEAMGMRRAM